MVIYRVIQSTIIYYNRLVSLRTFYSTVLLLLFLRVDSLKLCLTKQWLFIKIFEKNLDFIISLPPNNILSTFSGSNIRIVN